MFYFDVSILSQFLSIDLIWNLLQRVYSIFKGRPLKSNRGNKVFIFGSNSFIGTPNVLTINGKPSIFVENLGDKLYLTADFYDKSGKVVMKIKRNKVILNENNIFKIEEWERNKIKIINQYNEPIEIIAKKTGELELNGIFYMENQRFEATPDGLKIINVK